MTERDDGWTQELQDKISPFIGPLYDVVGRLEGYGDIDWSPRGQAVELYFCGPLPAELHPVIDDMERAGVGFRKIDIAHSQEEISVLLAELGTDLKRADIAYSKLMPTDRSSSITIAGPKVSDDPEMQARVRFIAKDVVGDMPIQYIPFTGYARSRPLRTKRD